MLPFDSDCEITNITKDSFGVETKGTPFPSECRINEDSGISTGKLGNQFSYSTLYFLPPGVNIKEGDKIRTTKFKGVAVTESEKLVKKAITCGVFMASHMEVYVV